MGQRNRQPSGFVNLAAGRHDPVDRWADYADSPTPNVAVSGPESIELGGEAVFDIYINQDLHTLSGQNQTQGIDLRSGQPYPHEDLDRVEFLLAGENIVYLGGQAVFVKDGHYQVVVDKTIANTLPGGAIHVEAVVVSKRISTFSTSGTSVVNQKYTMTFLPLVIR